MPTRRGSQSAERAPSRVASRLDKLMKIGSSLPEVEIDGEDTLHGEGRGSRYLRFRIGKKPVAYYMNDHHGDGIISLCCKAAPLEQDALIDSDPEQFYRPAYIGARGWVGIRLDLRRVDWQAVEELLVESYRLQAPKRLARLLEAD